MTIQEQVRIKKAQLIKELESTRSDILNKFPVSDYLSDVKSHLAYGRLSHSRRKRAPKGIFKRITSEYDVPVVSLYLKLALSCAIGESLEHLKEKNLPSDIVHLYHEWFERVLDEISTQPDGYYHHGCYSYVMDLMVCTLRDIPVGGAWLVEITRVGLRPFIDGNLGQCVAYLKFLVLEAGGFAPFCSIHTVPRFLSRFNKEEMDLSYKRIAEMMELHPNIKGVYRRSWFLDPKLDDISPELSYLREVPEQNGAKVFYAGSKERDIKYATSMSMLRKKLYAQGKYLPTGYAYVWPRKEFLEWVKKTNVGGLAESGCNKSSNT